MSKRLLVILSDYITNLISKGELIRNYYNPNDYFKEVFFILTNNDSVDIEAFVKTGAVGTATISIYNINTSNKFFFFTLGYRPVFLKKWVKEGLNIIEKINPDMIRCYGNRLSGYLGAKAHKNLGIPCVLSMHEDPDNIVKSERRISRTIQYTLLNSIAKYAMQNVDVVIASYKSIESYLINRGIKNYRLIYNAINGSRIQTKTDYSAHELFRIISVGRLIKIKNPRNLILAVSELENVEMLLVGDGPLYYSLQELIIKCNCKDRIKMVRGMPNDDICRTLKDYDLFAIHCDGLGTPKTVLESWLAGMPTMANHPASGKTVEYVNGENIYLVENSKAGYKAGIIEIMNNQPLREKLGIKGLEYMKRYCDPQKLENEVISLYEEIMR